MALIPQEEVSRGLERSQEEVSGGLGRSSLTLIDTSEVAGCLMIDQRHVARAPSLK